VHHYVHDVQARLVHITHIFSLGRKNFEKSRTAGLSSPVSAELLQYQMQCICSTVLLRINKKLCSTKVIRLALTLCPPSHRLLWPFVPQEPSFQFPYNWQNIGFLHTLNDWNTNWLENILHDISKCNIKFHISTCFSGVEVKSVYSSHG